MRVKGLLMALALAAAGCGGAAAEFVKLGDARASARDWNAAADAYASALRLDAGDDDVKAKLSLARRWQVNERLGRGEVEPAWPLALEAHRLAPGGEGALALLREVGRRVQAHAERAFAAGDLDRTGRLLDLAAEWDETAEATRGLRAKLDERLAELAYGRGEAERAAGRPAFAALAFAAADGHRRGFRDARARAGALRDGVVTELTYHVVIGPFDGDETALDLASHVTPTGVARALPGGAKLRVHPAVPAGKTLGLRLGGALESYRFARDVRSEARSCSYVCGQDRRPNPDLAAAEARAAAADGAVTGARQGAENARAGADEARRERERAESGRDEARRDLERARAGLDRCTRASDGAGGAGRCEGARAEVESGERRLESAESRRRAAETALDGARAELGAARRRLEGAVAEAGAARSVARQTPPHVFVDRTCPYSYRVDTHVREAAVGVRVAASALAGDDVVLEERLEPLRVSRSDATFAPRPGYCAEVAAGDPLELPAEAQFKDWLVDEAQRAVGRRVLDAYERQRAGHLRAARDHAAAGRRAEAAEAYLRWLLTAPALGDGASEREALEYASNAAGAKFDRARSLVAAPLASRPRPSRRFEPAGAQPFAAPRVRAGAQPLNGASSGPVRAFAAAPLRPSLATGRGRGRASGARARARPKGFGA